MDTFMAERLVVDLNERELAKDTGNRSSWL